MNKPRVQLIALMMLASFTWLLSCSKETAPEQTQQPAPPTEQQAAPATEPSQLPPPSSGSDVGGPVAAPSGEAASAAGDATAGKNIYAKKCATCHGKEGEGNAALARTMKVELRHLGSEEVQAKSDEELAANINEGTGKMRPVKGLSEAEVASMVAYVRSLGKK